MKNIGKPVYSFLAVMNLSLLLLGTALLMPWGTTAVYGQAVGVQNGEKLKTTGRITKHLGDVVTMKTTNNSELTVMLTSSTNIKSKGGFLSSGKDFNADALFTGLRVEVEGTGNAEGQVVAQKIRFKESDLEVSKSIDTRVTPVEDRMSRVETANEELASQVDELNNISKKLKTEIDSTQTQMVEMNKNVNDRVSALDDYDVKETATVLFPVNKSDLSVQAQQELDTIAQKALAARGYVIEIAGFTDTSGTDQKNRILSQNRADEVVHYLATTQNIPLRRIITPLGYGSNKAAADNSTKEGRELNRRVEVRILVNRGEQTASNR